MLPTSWKKKVNALKSWSRLASLGYELVSPMGTLQRAWVERLEMCSAHPHPGLPAEEVQLEPKQGPCTSWAVSEWDDQETRSTGRGPDTANLN